VTAAEDSGALSVDELGRGGGPRVGGGHGRQALGRLELLGGGGASIKKLRGVLRETWGVITGTYINT
jgi:hypothetical protein